MPICGFKQGLNESLSYKKSSQKAAPQKPWQWELGTVMFLLPQKESLIITKGAGPTSQSLPCCSTIYSCAGWENQSHALERAFYVFHAFSGHHREGGGEGIPTQNKMDVFVVTRKKTVVSDNKLPHLHICGDQNRFLKENLDVFLTLTVLVLCLKRRREEERKHSVVMRQKCSAN